MDIWDTLVTYFLFLPYRGILGNYCHEVDSILGVFFFVESSIVTVRNNPPSDWHSWHRQGWNSQVCPRAIGGITTCHKVIHSLFLPIFTYICMRERPHFHHGPTSSFLHSQPIQTPPSGPGLIGAADQEFIWDDPSVTPFSWSFTEGIPCLYPQCGTIDTVRSSSFEVCYISLIKNWTTISKEIRPAKLRSVVWSLQMHTSYAF